MTITCPRCEFHVKVPAPKPQSFKGRFGLTPREAQVADLVAEGHTNESAGRQLGLGEQLVKNYLRKVFDKTRVSSRVGLVRLAFGQEAE